MVTKTRWEIAQQYERSYWENAGKQIESGSENGLGWYEWRAGKLAERLQAAFPGQTPINRSALEVGSGPVGIISYLNAEQRVAIDPLQDFYRTRPELIRWRDARVDYRTGGAERLPFDDGQFDMVILDNVIDHVLDADSVMREIWRVLRTNGVLYFSVNLHPAWGGLLHRMVSRLKIDRGHPHTFTLPKVRRFLSAHHFDVRHEDWQDYAECKRADLQSPHLKDKLKALGGLSEFLYSCVGTKRG
jgi:SAM-dependent methyltransferase